MSVCFTCQEPGVIVVKSSIISISSVVECLTHTFAYRVHFMVRRCLRSPRQVYFAILTFWPHQEALSKSLSSGNIKIKIKVWGCWRGGCFLLTFLSLFACGGIHPGRIEPTMPIDSIDDVSCEVSTLSQAQAKHFRLESAEAPARHILLFS